MAFRKHRTTDNTSGNQFGGLNAQGTGKAYKGPKGFFQYGHEQYGYVNPQGKINWDAQMPKSGKLIGADAPMAWANQQGMMKDQYGLPIQRTAAPPAFSDPQYQRSVADIIYNRDVAREQYQSALNKAERLYGVETGRAQQGFTDATERAHASLAGRGMGGSGLSQGLAARRSEELGRTMAELSAQYGPEFAADLRRQLGAMERGSELKLQAEADAAIERKKAEDKLREEAGLPVAKAEGVKSGFEKRGSTWFYTNPQGVTVSLGSKIPPAVKKQQAKKKGK